MALVYQGRGTEVRGALVVPVTEVGTSAETCLLPEPCPVRPPSLETVNGAAATTLHPAKRNFGVSRITNLPKQQGRTKMSPSRERNTSVTFHHDPCGGFESQHFDIPPARRRNFSDSRVPWVNLSGPGQQLAWSRCRIVRWNG
jgi:hypothetical protein